MIAAVAAWLLGLAGVEPSDEALRRMIEAHRHRGHHLTFEFGRLNEIGGSSRAPGLALGYEFIADRRFHGISGEVLGTLYDNPFVGDEAWWVAAGFGYWPTRQLKIFVQGGPLFDGGEARFYGRGGLGWRTHFYQLAITGFGTLGSTDEGGIFWTFGGRIQF
ncbi:MAG TPA: hypothetical protein RMF84_18435 [Polyangiaceae bacterium LLY-WYZ-14_1]|nr:hypothetical protein [Polyangiaceae bacterium LLY-WYZ-14_1]